LSPGDVIASARTIVDQSDRMAAIIRQLLDFARRRGARSTVADLRDIVSRTVEMLAVLARSRRVDLDLTLPATPLPLRADPNQLQQALANVVVNGVQALPDGGRVRVTAGPYNGTTKHWSVVIEDDGVGISEQNLPRLFEPFFTTKGVGEGTGLGLAVAHGIVAEHGGWIDVSSAPGRGSRFEIVLEAEPEPARHAEAV
jgi:signal transduction histidine kinase